MALCNLSVMRPSPPFVSLLFQYLKSTVPAASLLVLPFLLDIYPRENLSPHPVVAQCLQKPFKALQLNVFRAPKQVVPTGSPLPVCLLIP